MGGSSVNLQGTALPSDPVHNHGAALGEEGIAAGRGRRSAEDAAQACSGTFVGKAERHWSSTSICRTCAIATRHCSTRRSCSDQARFVPIVYDPTIADAGLTYGHIYRRLQGCTSTNA